MSDEVMAAWNSTLSTQPDLRRIPGRGFLTRAAPDEVEHVVDIPDELASL